MARRLAVENAAILHLADLHYGKQRDPRFRTAKHRKCSADWRGTVTDDFIMQLGRLPVKPNLLVVSGDLTWKGDVAEFREAIDFIQFIAEHLGLDVRNQVVIVPGNHDLSDSVFLSARSLELAPFVSFWRRVTHGRTYHPLSLEDPHDAFTIHDCTRREMMRRIFTGNKVTLSRPPRR
jgi:metallophosphoesterase superfamily enzyme